MCTVTLALAGIGGVGSAIADRQAKMARYFCHYDLVLHQGRSGLE